MLYPVSSHSPLVDFVSGTEAQTTPTYCSGQNPELSLPPAPQFSPDPDFRALCTLLVCQGSPDREQALLHPATMHCLTLGVSLSSL